MTPGVKLTTNYAALMARQAQAFPLAVQDTVKAAQAAAQKHSKTGKWEKSITSKMVPAAANVQSAVIGSPLVSARAHEMGAYIQAKNALHLAVSVQGGVRSVDAVRLNPQPAVKLAGPQFLTFMTQRLQALSR